MKRTAGWNAGLLVIGLACALVGGLLRPARDTNRPVVEAEGRLSRVQRTTLPGGGEGLVDAAGQVLPLKRYQRIVSTSMLSDRLLAELAEPDRVLAYSTASARTSPVAWKFAGKNLVEGMGPLEPILALKPDLVLLNSLGADSRHEKLRLGGVEVFNLGELRGVSTLLPTAEAIGVILGAPDRGRQWAETFRARLARVSEPLGSRPRRRALYLAVIGAKLYGGTRGTSYHDVLVNAGLEDVAARDYADWPEYSAERLIALAPELIVTKVDMAQAICTHPGLETLEACRLPGRILALTPGLVDEPGPAILEAAERLFALAYPELTRAGR